MIRNYQFTACVLFPFPEHRSFSESRASSVDLLEPNLRERSKI